MYIWQMRWEAHVILPAFNVVKSGWVVYVTFTKHAMVNFLEFIW